MLGNYVSHSARAMWILYYGIICVCFYYLLPYVLLAWTNLFSIPLTTCLILSFFTGKIYIMCPNVLKITELVWNKIWWFTQCTFHFPSAVKLPQARVGCLCKHWVTFSEIATKTSDDVRHSSSTSRSLSGDAEITAVKVFSVIVPSFWVIWIWCRCQVKVWSLLAAWERYWKGNNYTLEYLN
jgi:hypothetical protein